LKIEEDLKKLINAKKQKVKEKFNRHVSIPDLFSDRWETAKFYGFGEGSSCYNNVLIIGNVFVGIKTWIGPNVILDGSGNLNIGDFVSISAGVQIYTHNSISWSNSMGKNKIDIAPTNIGNGVFIGPNSIIEKGITIGSKAVIGAMSFVNKDVPPNAKFYGNKLFN
jgi:acetyltransferase-like isoleucine patch superfamily enzyme